MGGLRPSRANSALADAGLFRYAEFGKSPDPPGSVFAKMSQFRLTTDLRPTGDQPQAIDKLVHGVLDGMKMQTLLGVTGSGKTFTMANVIERLQRPTLVIAHNKTLAAQLCSEFREFFGENAVGYFVS